MGAGIAHALVRAGIPVRLIEADAKAGKLDARAEEALAEYHAGKATEI